MKQIKLDKSNQNLTTIDVSYLQNLTELSLHVKQLPKILIYLI